MVTPPPILSSTGAGDLPPRLQVVLVEPEIPPNTGNIARLCAATRTTLHLIQPLGFKIDDKQLKRAGMDYWQQVAWHVWPGWRDFQRQLPPASRLWFIESGGPMTHAQASYQPGDCLVFGRETAGLPRALLQAHREQWLRLPMFNPKSRSLNLSSCVAVVLFEALRQLNFPGEWQP